VRIVFSPEHVTATSVKEVQPRATLRLTLGGQPFAATFADGSVRTGTLDAQGSAVLTSVPPGDVDVVLPNDPDAVLTISDDEVA
jgi:hypothetical protein